MPTLVKQYEEKKDLGNGVFQILNVSEFTNKSIRKEDSGYKEINGKRVDKTISMKMVQIRKERDQLLRDSDWTQLPLPADSTLTAADVAAWATYRQALRNFPTVVDLNNVVWPIPPA